MERAGLPIVPRTSISSPSIDAPFDCPLCGTSAPLVDTYALPCGHRHCLSCWTNWLEAAYEKGPECLFTHCLEYKCPVLVDIQFFLDRMVGEKKDKLEGWILRSFVKNNIYIKWCPAAGCDKAVEYTPGGVKTVTCTCGFAFCFACGREEHAPCACGVIND
jgi:ariadne-1